MPLFGRPNRAPAPPKVEDPPAAPPPPALTKEDIAAAVSGATAPLRAELEAKIAELRGALSVSQAPVAPAAPAAPARAVITDEDIENALTAGDTRSAAARLRALVDGQVRDLESSVNRRMDEITTRGMTSIASVTREVVLTKLPQYKKFQKEIDERVAALPPAAQADAAVLKIVHDSVVGQHIAEIEREAHEAALRSSNDDGSGTAAAPTRKTSNAPGGGGRGDSRAVPSLAEFAGDDSLGALKDKDRRSGVKDEDSFAQSLGYENWAHYMQVEAETRAEAEKLGITLR